MVSRTTLYTGNTQGFGKQFAVFSVDPESKLFSEIQRGAKEDFSQ